MNLQENISQVKRLMNLNEGVDKHGWGTSKKKLSKNFEFKDFDEAMKFVNKIAKIAEKQNHHPDITIKYNKVNVTITDHEKGGVSDKCEKFVLKVNELK